MASLIWLTYRGTNRVTWLIFYTSSMFSVFSIPTPCSLIQDDRIPSICGFLTKSRDDDRITCVLYSSQHKASSFGVIRQITGIGAYQLCWNQIHGVLSNPMENTQKKYTRKDKNMVSIQLCHTRYGRIIESLLVLQNSSDPLSSFNIGKDCINFRDKKLGVTCLPIFANTSSPLLIISSPSLTDNHCWTQLYDVLSN